MPWCSSRWQRPFNSQTTDRNKRLEIVHYGPDHKEISRAYYQSPDNRYKYLKCIDLAVIGGEKVIVLAFAYNTVPYGGKESALTIATLNAGAKEVTLDELHLNSDQVVRHLHRSLREKTAERNTPLPSKSQCPV